MHSRAERLEYARSHYARNSADYKERARKNNERARKAGRALTTAYLSEHPCVDCGERDVLVLQFDHVRGVKKGNVTDLVREACSIRTLLREIEKCDVRCANCHQRRTTRARREVLKGVEAPQVRSRQFRLDGV